MVDDRPIREELLELAVDVLGDPEKADRWLRKPNRGLSGESPLNRARTEKGKAEVLALLGRIASGVYS